MTVVRVVHPRHGTHDPRRDALVPAPGTVRRTTSLDMLRPDGVQGPVLLVGRGRDLLFGPTSNHPLGQAQLHVAVAFLDGRRVTGVSSQPELPAVQLLVGASASSGFRARLDEVLPEQRDAQSLLHQLLDDVPVATLVSGYAVGAAGVLDAAARSKHRWTPDLCAGWRTGGTIMIDIDTIGRPPVVTGPPAPDWSRGDDTAWPDLQPLPAHGMRRLRMTDVSVEGAEVRAASWFQDSYVAPDGKHTVIHEYDVDVAADLGSGTVTRASATARVLPWVECPAAAESAGWLVGCDLPGLRAHIRTAFTGTATCTHLNDQLRSLAAVPALAARVRG